MKPGSILEAAQNLGRTQPAVSLALKVLQETLEMTSFDRDIRALKPVPEAYFLLAKAESVLTQASQLHRTMGRMQIGDDGEV
ncbi:hypothetical protein ROLI_008970 [Roseobacter fucihabitans]|uniref:HTH lysR-type domain-containing protein n=2 Tax=Roseobacter fucihabitans TaxID=1537242 RepID=A0ABZ2BPA1_9RHOB|nr:Bacterial regulatory helix-turn-helix protein, lysR family [Roseobacter litoralis]